MRSTLPTSARARAGIVALALGVGLVGWGASAASAAPIDGAITGIAASPITVGYGGNVRMTIDFCVPDGTLEGDTFTSTIPPQLVGENAPAGFDLKDAGGNLVATAAKSGAAPSFVYTFTMSSYAQAHNNVCGSAFYETAILGSLAGTDIPLTSVTNDGTPFTTTVHEAAAPPVDSANPRKVGSFPAGVGQCTTTTVDCILWSVQSPVGPLASGTLTDTLDAGQSFDCASAAAVIGAPAGNFPYISGTTAYAGGSLVSCGGTGFVYSFGAVPAGQIVQISLLVNASAADPDGDHVYSNSVHSSVVGADGVTRPGDATASIRSATAGGNGAGDGLSIVKYLTAQGPIAGDYDAAPGFEHAAGTPVPISLTVANTGTTALRNVAVTDATASGPALTGLSCAFPDGTSGTIWSGPFAAGASFPCTGTIPASAAGVQEADTATVTAIGNGTPTASDAFASHTAAAPAPVSVGDYVWIDADHDGVQEPGEVGVAGVTLTLTDPAGNPVTDINGAAVGPTITDASGHYLFGDLPPGTYTVHIDYSTAPADLIPTVDGVVDRATDSSLGSATSLALAAGGQDLTLDFGLWSSSLPTLPFFGDDTPAAASGGLAFTGGGVSWPLLVGGGGLLFLGLGLTLLVRRSRA
ncbi:MAG: hypothetical protein JWN36_3244 [Microbacteriaceae bacterium]|nr:hypothetical protein [Microbacteriaceae bacterium]